MNYSMYCLNVPQVLAVLTVIHLSLHYTALLQEMHFCDLGTFVTSELTQSQDYVFI